MPSTNKLSSHRLRSNSQHHVSGSLAKFLLSFCGIASFGVFTILTSTNTNALSTVSNQISVTIPGSIALRLLDSTATAEIDSLSFDLTPTASGTALTKRTIVDVATSNPTGYKLYMQSNYQKSGSYTTDLVHTDSSVADSIPTSTSASTLYWNYNNPLTSTTNPIPAHGTPDKIGQRLDAPTNSDQIPIDINVSVDTSIVSGTYENQLLFSAVGNPTSVNYSIAFNPDGGSPAPETITATAAAGVYSTTIPNTMPMKSGLMFDHWEVQSAAPYTTTAKCNNTTSCVPGDTIIVHSDEVEFKGDITLKAIYRQVFSGITNMQQMTPAICSAASTGDTTILSDTRDSNTYTVKKLLDGRCWMTQNLRLVGPMTSSQLNSTNTNVRPSSTFELTASDSSAWCTEDTSECYNQSYILASDKTEYGVYYNWYAATAGTGTYETSAATAESSVCPKGWRLPTGDANGEFKTLNDYYPSVSDMLGEPNFALAGRHRGASTSLAGKSGYYWGSTAQDNFFANSLRIDSDGDAVYPSYVNGKLRGYTLRCIAAQEYTLTVNPNGGTWSGSTDTQYFDQEPSTTKNIPNPTGQAYTISYDMGSTGMPAPSSPTSTNKAFISWNASGSGTFTNNTYTFGNGDGSLSAQYSNQSETFTLPAINNAFSGTCKWAEGSTSGTQYAPGTQRAVSGNTTYYAMCYMQEMTTDICANAPLNSTAVLTDIRDNNTYSVKKLKDGKCWMTQNLRLTGPQNLTPANSNVRTNWSLPTQTSESDDGSTAGANKWCTEQNQECVDRAVNLNTNNYDYGTYYTWNAATAGTGTYDMTSGNTDSSICPKGWRLPTGASGGEFQVLYNYYNSYDSVLDSNGPAYVLAGVQTGNKTYYQGTRVLYWASTTNSNITAFDIDLISEDQSVHPADRSNRTRGFSVRCVATTQEHVLTVNPNGGTWNGSTSTQYFEQTSGTTKNISNPTGPAYTISYDMGSTGIPAPSSPTSTNRAFTSWATSGSGTLVNGIYTFGDGNGTLLAQYSTNSVAFTMPTVSKTGHNCHWAAGGVDYDSGQTGVKISGNTTFTAVCTPINYPVSVTNSNTTSGASSLSIPYGESRTVTVTPSSGYYLSSVTCPIGYTCSGYSTDPSKTGTQTVTVKNNDTTSGGTLTFTGTALTLAQMCANASIHGTFTYSGVEYIKLKTSADGSTTACYTHSSVGNSAWGPIGSTTPTISICPAGTGVPTLGEFQALINTYGSDGTIYNTTGWSGRFWSATSGNAYRAYGLVVRSSSTAIDGTASKTISAPVVCIVQ